MEPEVNLKLSLAEVNFLLAKLGEMPTGSNAWPLMMKVRTQAEDALRPKPEETKDEPQQP